MNSFITLFKERIQDNGKKMTQKQVDILEACVELFAERGFSNTSTRDIALKADVAEGTIFKHFGTKQNLLFVTVLPMFSDIIFDEILGVVDEESGKEEVIAFEDLIHNILFNRLSQATVNHKTLKIFLNEILYQKELQEELLKLITQKLVDRVANLLHYYKRDQQIVDLPNDTIIRFILSPIFSYILLEGSPLNIRKGEREKEFSYMEQLIIKGLSPSK